MLEASNSNTRYLPANITLITMSLFAVIETGGKQYKVSEGDVLSVEKLQRANGEEQSNEKENFFFDEVLLVAGDEVRVGKPYVDGARVEAKILEEGKGKKKIVFRYKAKTRRHKKRGHRQPFTKIQIMKIEV